MDRNGTILGRDHLMRVCVCVTGWWIENQSLYMLLFHSTGSTTVNDQTNGIPYHKNINLLCKQTRKRMRGI